MPRHVIRPVKQSLAGWGNYPVQAAEVFRPERWDDAVDIVKQAPVKSLISRGLGRHYGDAALNEGGGVLLHGRLNRLLDFDPQTAILECEAGVSFAEIIDIFLPRGYFLPVTPGTRYVTVGGAIAADIHGKNHHRDGSIASFIVDFRLLTGTGEIMTCSPEANADAFWATLGGMGLTGVILSARLRLLPVTTAYLVVDYQRVGSLDEVLAQFTKSDARYQYSVAWIDCLAVGGSLGRGVLIRGNHAEPSQLDEAQRRNPLTLAAKPRLSIPFFAPGFTLNPLSVRLFNTFYYKCHPTRQSVIYHYHPFFYPLDAVLHWNRIYGKRGFIQYQAVFDLSTSRQGLGELLEQLAQSRRASFLAVLKSFGEGNQGLLSFPRLGHTLALDIPNTGTDLVEFVRKLDHVVLKHGGRIYLAKDACLEPDTFAAMYPNVGRFKEIKQKLDPQRRFTSSLARRLRLVEDR